MQSLSAFDARARRIWIAAGIGAAHVVLTASAARADEKRACSAAYDQIQVLKRAGKLAAARQQAAICTRDGCAEFIRTDCAQWLGEIDASQPTVVFEVLDATGKDTNLVHIELDGKPLRS